MEGLETARLFRGRTKKCKFALAAGCAMVQGQINRSCKVILMFSSDFLVAMCMKINLRVERQGKWGKLTHEQEDFPRINIF